MRDLPSPSQPWPDDLLHAALTGLFDPRALIPDDAPNAADRLAALAPLAVERELDGRWFWTLTADARRAGLARLPADPAQRAAVLAGVPRLDGDRLGAALRAALAAKPDPALRSLLERGRKPWRDRGKATSSDGPLDPNALAQALELLEEAGIALPDWAADPTTARALRRAVVLDRRARAAHRLLPTAFRGRHRELRALEHYILTGEAADDAARPVLETLDPAPPAQDIAAVVVTGIGGTGKSALIEALRRRTEREAEVTFLGFDLDQTALRSGERLALTTELLRQIGLLHPGLDKPLSGIRQMLRDRLSSVTDDSARLEVASSAIYSAFSELHGRLEAAGLKDHGFALVFDTFEQALVVGEERLRLFADWLALLRHVAGIDKLRVILSGREADMIAGVDTPGLAVVARIELGDLGTNAGRAKLRDMFRRWDIPHLDLVDDLIAAFGSNPLVIEIVANFCRGRPRGEIAALLREGDDGQDMRGALGAEMRQRILYSRILNRISDPELRPLASPGLILRRITPQLIEEVLAEPCGLQQPLPPGKADELYKALAEQVWLVRPAPSGGALEHVPDLRRVMLPQILSLPEAETVARAAAEWYQSQAAGQTSPDLWEAQYYRALLDPDALDPVPRDALLAIADHLGAAAADLPAKPRAQLREASGAVLRLDEIAALTGEARSRASSKRAAQQLSEGLEQSVLDEAAAGLDAAWTARHGTAPDGPSSGVADDGATQSDASVAVALFAAASYDELARTAPAQARALWQNAADKRPARGHGIDLNHPAWLTAIATLSPDLPPDRHAALAGAAEAWAHETVDAGGGDILLAKLADGQGDMLAQARLATLVLALAQAPRPPFQSLQNLMGHGSGRPVDLGRIDTA
ncbi:MAG: ATP-binding protein, partial [Paracoccaceae bacterium]